MNVKINKFCKFTNHLSKQHSMNIPTNYSGEGKYLALWEKYRVIINTFLRNGGGATQMSPSEFNATGNRDKYSFTMTIVNGEIPTLSGSAVARDLKAILDGSKSFKSYAAGKTIKISLTSDFNIVVAYI